jgi:hypothetical protein
MAVLRSDPETEITIPGKETIKSWQAAPVPVSVACHDSITIVVNRNTGF